MKTAPTVADALKNTPAIRTTGDVRALLANTMLALARGEIGVDKATAMVGCADSMCNVMNTEVKAIRLRIEMAKEAKESVKLQQFGQLLIEGEAR